VGQPKLEDILSSPRLPTLPAIAMQVIELTQRPEIDLKEIATLVMNDQALSSKILRTVNSSYYGLSKRCGTINQAMVYLGLNTVKTLALGFSLIEATGKVRDVDGMTFDFMNYWRRGLYGAAAARELANRTRVGDPEEAFLTCIMQDMGMVAMWQVFGRPYCKLLSVAGSEHLKLPAVEQKVLSFTHQRIGSEIIARWRLPETVMAGIQFHHDAREAPENHRNFCRLIDLACNATSVLSNPQSEATKTRYVRKASRWFDFNEKQALTLLARIADAGQELSDILQINTGQAANVVELMEQAEQALLYHQIGQEREKQALRDRNEKLVREVEHDPLTGAANRKHFDALIELSFDEAVAKKTNLGLIFCDADHFKHVNDQYGHQAGDMALCALAESMTAVVDAKGTVCRYGGEEFAIVLPGMDRLQTTKIAEQVRCAIEAHPVDITSIDAQTPNILLTASLGVAALDDTSRHCYMEAASLVRKADQAVYAAKHGGRNCVRVFKPRPVATRAA
jgi:two-component system cell cycle response regulator